MKATERITLVKKRISELFENPPFRFKNTKPEPAAEYMKKFIDFEGYSAKEIEQAEARWKLIFPESFRAYLLQMGKKRGQLFQGSDVAGLDQFPTYRKTAQRILGRSTILDPNAIVFLSHQGYQCIFLQPNGDSDCPVFLASESGEIKKVSESFLDFLEKEVNEMEHLHKDLLASGGYYVTVVAKGNRLHVNQQYPSRLSGDRPCDSPFEMGDLNLSILLEKAATDTEAQWKLALCYFNSENDVNIAEAMYWCKIAALNGHLDAIAQMGNCYDGGLGVNADPVEAVKWWLKGAEKGNKYCLGNLGECYDKGKGGLMRDPAEALRFYRLARENGLYEVTPALKRVEAELSES